MWGDDRRSSSSSGSSGTPERFGRAEGNSSGNAAARCTCSLYDRCDSCLDAFGTTREEWIKWQGPGFLAEKAAWEAERKSGK